MPSNTQLTNTHLTLSLSLPGAPGTYCGTRFSWAGIITEATCGEHRLFGPWQSGALPLDLHDNVSGTAGEFDDSVTWLGPATVFNRLIQAGQLP